MSIKQLTSSELGTKSHWDDTYQLEIANFEDHGDEGEIWFGSDTLQKMVDWVTATISADERPFILDIGTGNGSMPLKLAEAGFEQSRILGIDYSEASIDLSRAIADAEGCSSLLFQQVDFLQDDPSPLDGMSASEEGWDLLLDKGTFDAIALAETPPNAPPPTDLYRHRVGRLLKPGGHFLITSCNFTVNELTEYFASPVTGFIFVFKFDYPTISFGGQQGSTYSSVVFHKPNKTSAD